MSEFTCERQHVAADHERVVVVGEIDLASGPRLSSLLHEAQACARHVVLDLDETTFIDTGGARILLAADAHARETGGTFAIAGPPAAVTRLLEMVGARETLVDAVA